MKAFVVLLVLTLAWMAGPSRAAAGAAAGTVEPRVVVGIYDAQNGAGPEVSYLFEMAEFPLNHLGLELESHNAAKLPDLSARTDVRGVLIWLIDAARVDARKLADWTEAAVKRGLPVLLIGPAPGGESTAAQEARDRLFAAIGLRNLGGYRPYTYDVAVARKDSAMVEFERKLPVPLPPLEIVQPRDARARSHLVFARAGQETHAVVLTPQGGYVAPGYAHYEDATARMKAWRVNPFALFAAAFRTEGLPAFDISTVAGRRLYYSHIDGDGWNSVTEADGYAKQGLRAAEVVLREIVAPNPDLPVTVAPIAADLDPDWAGDRKAQDLARAFFGLAHVEAGTHTYTHPFEWAFFGPGYDPAAEMPFANRYAKTRISPKLQGLKPKARRLNFPYDVPRAYGDIPFDIDTEIGGSIAYIGRLLPPGKRVALIQWSGDTLTFPAAMEAAARSGLPNINGRASRFDGDFPSYASVAPAGLRIGPHVRVYASHANENEYTALWQGRYFGFRYLPVSLANTERPRRVKPINVYYHMYSGEKQAALSALKEVMTYVRAQDIAPVTASRFARIVEGFFSARLVAMAPRHWRVENRGALETVRVDDAGGLYLDYAGSKGVIGHARQNGSLYVTLDAAEAAPEILLGEGREPAPPRPVLHDARWRVFEARFDGPAIVFRAEGFGEGRMLWRAPGGPGQTMTMAWRSADGREGRSTAVADAKGLAAFAIPSHGFNRVAVRLTPKTMPQVTQ